MENLFMALSNLTCILPIYTSWRFKDGKTCLCLCLVSTASFVSHLVENHKHGMPGFFPEMKRSVSYAWNRIDVLGCLILISRLLYLYVNIYGLILEVQLLPLSLPILLNLISEYDQYNPDLKIRYLCLHSLWHLMVFINLNIFLTTYIYNI